jgi:hypothetical protein
LNQEQANEADEQKIKAALEKSLKEWVEKVEREKAQDEASNQNTQADLYFH